MMDVREQEIRSHTGNDDLTKTGSGMPLLFAKLTRYFRGIFQIASRRS
jgi:hypothetical protein